MRCLLHQAYPFYKNLSPTALGNIRRKAFLALSDPNYDENNMDPLQLMKYMPTGMDAADELSPHDPTVMKQNFGKILAGVMRNSEYTWKALDIV